MFIFFKERLIFINSLDIIVPCYNEALVLLPFFENVSKVMKNINYPFKFIFVDDGSCDDTLYILKKLATSNENVKYISFSRNFGKESAMYAGLKNSSADMVLIIDADLQNPPNLIPSMIDAIKDGYDCCAGYRQNRLGEGFIRNMFSNFFYKITDKISDVNMPNGAGDFRIMSRKMVNAVLSLSEFQRFSKGIFSWVGFKTKWLPFDNVKRVAGQSKWRFSALFSYAIDGITAFSTFPLKVVSFLGLFVSFSSFAYLFYIVIKTLILGVDVPGYASIITIILFIGGIIILCCGIIGEYIGKIYLEVKNRPIYIIDETNLN